MTDERREDVRRSEDQSMTDRIETLEANQARFIDALLGPPKVGAVGVSYDVAGDVVRDKPLGIEYKVEFLYKAAKNGGLRVRLPKGAWAAIIAAIVAGIFQIVAALVSSGA
jgi:hypothetical protein